eukprot:763461-Hanusia_phi.AAC.3
MGDFVGFLRAIADQQVRESGVQGTWEDRIVEKGNTTGKGITGRTGQDRTGQERTEDSLGRREGGWGSDWLSERHGAFPGTSQSAEGRREADLVDYQLKFNIFPSSTVQGETSFYSPNRLEHPAPFLLPTSPSPSFSADELVRLPSVVSWLPMDHRASPLLRLRILQDQERCKGTEYSSSFLFPDVKVLLSSRSIHTRDSMLRSRSAVWLHDAPADDSNGAGRGEVVRT